MPYPARLSNWLRQDEGPFARTAYSGQIREGVNYPYKGSYCFRLFPQMSAACSCDTNLIWVCFSDGMSEGAIHLRSSGFGEL